MKTASLTIMFFQNLGTDYFCLSHKLTNEHSPWPVKVQNSSTNLRIKSRPSCLCSCALITTQSVLGWALRGQYINTPDKQNELLSLVKKRAIRTFIRRFSASWTSLSLTLSSALVACANNRSAAFKTPNGTKNTSDWFLHDRWVGRECKDSAPRRG